MSVIAPKFQNTGLPILSGTQQTKSIFDDVNVSVQEIRRKEKPEIPTDTSQWTPAFHLKAPRGWLNDPCGLGYDTSSGLYHVSFQWNPKGNDWGNMSWCHSTSDDLVTWTTSPEPCLTPAMEYDQCGVFTGCLRPTDSDGNPGALTVIYTSVKHLPIHYTIPYVRGCESLSLAVSHDGGETWKRPDCNPILPGPPSNVQVTGWRDPYIGPWPSMSSNANATPSRLHGFLSGGIAGKTPTVFAYAVNPADLRDWKYVGYLADVGLNFRPSRWSGDFGVNWEVANVLGLSSKVDGVFRTFVIMGTEGCLRPSDNNHTRGRVNAQAVRPPRQQLWMSLKDNDNENTKDSGALMKYSFAGVFDHGCLYAANSFHDPRSDQHLVYGWITEDDLPDGPRHAQGWSGMISLPRVVKLTSLRNVIRARRSELKDITSVEAEPDGQGTFTIRTLGIQPDDRLKKLRTHASHSTLRCMSLYSARSPTVHIGTSKWEAQAKFTVPKHCGRVGIQIVHGADTHHTNLFWEPLTETFLVERPKLADSTINHGTESAPHTLFTFLDDRGFEREETLQIHAIFDRSVLEVFVNERTAITTRIYVNQSSCSALRFFVESVIDDGDARPAGELLHAQVWDNLGV